MTRSLVKKTENLKKSSTEVAASETKQDIKGRQETRKQEQQRQPRTEQEIRRQALQRQKKAAKLQITEENMAELIQTQAIATALANEIKNYYQNQKLLKNKISELRDKQSQLLISKTDLNILLSQLPEHKARISEIDGTATTLTPSKNGFTLMYEERLEVALPLKLHKNVLSRFIAAHVKNNLPYLSELQRHLDLLFGYETTPEKAEQAYNNLLILLKKETKSFFGKKTTLLSIALEQQLSQYLKVLYMNGLLTRKTDKISFRPQALEDSLSKLFKTQIGRDLYSKDQVDSIKHIYELEHQPTITKSVKTSKDQENKEVNSRQEMLDKLDELNALGKVFVAETTSDIIQTTVPIEAKLESESQTTAQKLASKADELVKLPEVQYETHLKDHLEKIAAASKNFTQLAETVDDLRLAVADLEDNQARFLKLNEVFKYQILAAFTQYTQAMQVKTGVERLVHTTQGLNLAKNFVLSLQDTDYPETLELVVNFLESTESLRNNSFATILLKIFHAPIYGVMDLLKGLSAPHTQHKVKANLESQLEKYHRQADIHTGFEMAGEGGVKIATPSEATISQNKVSVALNKNLTGWYSLFSKNTHERRFVRNATTNALRIAKNAGAVVTTVGTATLVSLTAPHHAAEAAGIAAAGSYGFLSYCEAAVNRIMRSKKIEAVNSEDEEKPAQSLM